MRKNLLVLIALLSGWACAQETRPPRNPLSTTVEIGAQVRLVDGSKTFGIEQHRDVPRGAIMRRLDFQYLSEGNPLRFTFRSFDLFQRDMLFNATLENATKFKVTFDWEGFTRNWSSQNPMVSTESSQGVYTAPLSSRIALQKATGTAFQDLARNLINTSPQTTVRNFRERNTAELAYRLSEGLTFSLRYMNERKSGHRPWAYGTFAGSFERGAELPMPTPYVTNEMTAALDYNKGNVYLGAEYRGSYFTNNRSAITFENWFQADPVQASSSAERGLMAVSQAALPPSNHANSFTFKGMILMPMNSRASALINWSRWSQDETFLPYSLNTAITSTTLPAGASITSVDSLPQRSYNGEMNILTQDYAFVSRPVKQFQYSVRYNDYDLANDSPEIEFPGRSGYSDSQWVTEAGGYPASPITPALDSHAPHSKSRAFRRQQTDITAAIRPVKDLIWKSGYRYERYHREEREVDLSREHGFHTTLTYAPKSPLYIKAGYRHFDRTPNLYEAVESHPDFYRMWEQGERRRRQGNALISYNLSPGTAITATWFNGSDTFDKSLYGLHQMQLNSLNADFTWTAPNAMAFFAGWGYDRSGFDYTLVANTGTYNFANSFARDNREGVHFAQAGLSGTYAGDRGEYTLTYAGTLAKTTITTSNPFPVQSVGSAGANPFPDVKNQFHELRFNTSIALRENVRLGVNYLLEPYRLNDFSQDIIGAYIPGQLDQDVSPYAYNDLPLRNYTGNVVAFYVRYTIR